MVMDPVARMIPYVILQMQLNKSAALVRLKNKQFDRN